MGWIFMIFCTVLIFLYAKYLEVHTQPYPWLKYLVLLSLFVYTIVLFTNKPTEKYQDEKDIIVWTKISVLICFLLYSGTAAYTNYKDLDAIKQQQITDYQKQKHMVQDYFKNKNEKIVSFKDQKNSFNVKTDKSDYEIVLDDKKITIYKSGDSISMKR
jgi:Ca2+/Na+ antiporter